MGRRTAKEIIAEHERKAKVHREQLAVKLDDSGNVRRLRQARTLLEDAIGALGVEVLAPGENYREPRWRAALEAIEAEVDALVGFVLDQADAEPQPPPPELPFDAPELVEGAQEA